MGAPGFYSGTQPIAITPGDSFEVESHISRTLEHSFTSIAVPTLTVQLDEEANLIYGQAPAQANLSLDLQHQGLPQLTMTTTADARGTYSISLNSRYALSADDVANLTYQPPRLPQFIAAGSLPVLHAKLYNSAQPVVWGWLTPYEPYTLSLKTPQKSPVLWQALAEGSGSFETTFEPPQLLKPGDTLVLTTSHVVRQLTLPVLSAQINRTTANVFGQAAPNTRLRVEVARQFYAPAATLMTTVTANGTYSVSFPALAGSTTLFGKLTNFDADGDQTDLDFGTIQYSVNLDEACLSGRAPMSRAQITLTLRSGDGAFKSMLVTPAQPQYTGCFTTAIHSGDRLSLSTGDITETYTVPQLTAQHDYGQQVLTGWTSANQLVRVELEYHLNVWFQTMADAAGHYGLDISGLPPAFMEPMAVSVVDAAGNITTRRIVFTSHQQLLPIVRR